MKKLWPSGHGIPGPYVTEDQIREAINTFRRQNKFGKNPEKPYHDPFRRVRELQGEEGLVGVARKGRIYQLVSLDLREKRVPRTKLSSNEWENILVKINTKYLYPKNLLKIINQIQKKLKNF